MDSTCPAESRAQYRRTEDPEALEKPRGQHRGPESDPIIDLEFLSQTAMTLVNLTPQQDLTRFIVERLENIVGEALIIISTFDERTDSLCVRHVVGLGEHESAVHEMLGRNPVGMRFSISEDARLGLTKGKLIFLPGALHTLSFGRIPTSVCETIEETLGFFDACVMGFSRGAELLGSAAIIGPKPIDPRKKNAIETLVCLASVILQRRDAEERLKRAHDDLEQRVAERTAEITRANDRLQQEINVREEAQEALRQSFETLLTVLDSIDADVYVADLETHEILLMNRHMKDSFGQDLEGQPCYQALRSESKPCAHCSNSRLLDTHGVPTGVLVWEGRNPVTGKGYINWDRAVRWTDGRFVRLQVATDVTKLRETEQEKKKLESQLLHTQRIESIGTLAGGIAHNFNNLLMSIQGNASLMLLDTDPAHPYYRRLRSIEESVDSGSRLTSQLLGYARQGRYEVRPINLNQLVQETSHTFATARKEIRVHHELAEDLLGVEADQGQIEQALMNLYVNAADAMPQGGDLFLRTMNVGYEDMTEKAYQPRPGTYVLLTLRDTGVGMDQQTMDRMFEPFFTTKGLVRGTGLGLASVYGIVKSHGGYIDVDSSKNQGATFSLYLPGTEKDVTKERRGSRELMEGKGTVLLVDDEEMVVDVGEQMLKRLGYDVVLARSGAETLKIYQDNPNKIDMVILDMIMPDMGGGETYDQLKEINPTVRVLLSSGYSIDGQATEILERGCDGFIQKPFSLGSLSHKLREILDDFQTP